MAKAIVYKSAEGHTEICLPAPWGRLCAAVTFEGKTFTLDPRTPFDAQVRRFGTDALSPEWAETEDAFVARVVAKDVPVGAENVAIVDTGDIPADRTFRAAWKPDLSIDMDAAREIHRDALRAARAPRLAALDVAYVRADEDGDEAKKREIAAEKQTLRDVTEDPAIDTAETPEELKAAWPSGLKG